MALGVYSDRVFPVLGALLALGYLFADAAVAQDTKPATDSASDVVSGTVVAEPAGKAEAEKPSDILEGVVIDVAATPAPTRTRAACATPLAHEIINVGSNAAVGSGARLKDKAVSTALGVVGGLLGGSSPRGGSAQGPRLVRCTIGDSEMTVFNDPATGVALRVGAKRAGDKVTVFADIDKSPETGTFQTSFLENAESERMAPSDVGVCKLWGEWNLSVSWTRTTYVNNQLVSRESGGWNRSGAFNLPGIVSTASAPDGTWKRLGFSNASHGAREVAMTYAVPASNLSAAPVDLVIHVTRPEQSPVTTAPFILRMSETRQGFGFTREPETACAQQSP